MKLIEIVRSMSKSGNAKIFSAVFGFFVVLLLTASVLGGESGVECSDFVETADGKYFCADDEKVYDCSSVNNLALNEECDDAVENELNIDNFFGDYHIPDGGFIAQAYHYIKPKQIYDAPAKVYYTVINKNPEANSITKIIVEKKVSYEQPVYGTKEVCEFNEINQTNDCWDETDNTNIIDYKTLYKWENVGSDKSILEIQAFEQPEIRGTFVLEKPTTQSTYYIDVIPHIEFEHPVSNKLTTYSQIEWEDITPTSDSLIVWLDCEGDLVDNAGGNNQGGTNSFNDAGDTAFETGMGVSGQNCRMDNDDYITYTGEGIMKSTFIEHSFSVCFWVNSSSNYIKGWLLDDDATGSAFGKIYEPSVSQVFQRHNNNVNEDTLQVFTTIDNSEKAYWCFTYDSSNTNGTIYRDGVSEGNNPGFDNQGDVDTYIFQFNIDSDSAVTNGETLYDEMTIWNVSLPPEDIQSLYDNDGVPFSPNTAPYLESSVTLTPEGTTGPDFDFTCAFKPLDDDSGDTLTAIVDWYKDDIITVSNDRIVVNGTLTSFKLENPGNTTIGDEWHCGVIIDDGTVNSTQVNSSTTTITSTANWTDFTSPAIQSDNVKDVFVYDTNKESWNRTDESTSWRIEISKDFPDKVYLFLTDKGLDIVDASDDSIWMDFQNGVDYAIEANEFNSIYALNGKVYIGSDEGLYVLDFANDNISRYDNSNGLIYTNNSYPFKDNVRNEGVGYVVHDGTKTLASDVVNDVNANRVRGTPFVAVATDGSASGAVSIINMDEGSIAELDFCENPNDYDSDSVFIADDGTLYFSENEVNKVAGETKLSYKYNIDTYTETDGRAEGYDSSVKVPARCDKVGYRSSDFGIRSSPYPHFLSEMINDVYVTSETSRRHIGHNTVYVATEEGITVIQEIQDNEGRGIGKRYGYTGSSENVDYKVLEGQTDNVTAVTARSDGNAFYVGTNDGSGVGSVSKISLNSNTLVDSWNTTTDTAIVGNDTTSLDFLDGDLLIGTLDSGATQIVEQELDHYLITEYGKHRIVEIDSTGLIHFEFGVYNVAGSDGTHLNSPTDAARLVNGNTLIADYGKAKKFLNWEPKDSLETIIENAWKWHQKKPFGFSKPL